MSLISPEHIDSLVESKCGSYAQDLAGQAGPWQEPITVTVQYCT